MVCCFLCALSSYARPNIHFHADGSESDDYSDWSMLEEPFDEVVEATGELFSDREIYDALRKSKYIAKHAITLLRKNRQAKLKKLEKAAADAAEHASNAASKATGAATGKKSSAPPEEPMRVLINRVNPFNATVPEAVVKSIEKGECLPSASVVIIGHVDSGKSTLLGRILVDSGNVTTDELANLAKMAQASKKSSFALAWVLDTGTSERSHGITVDIATRTLIREKTAITFVDAPGHSDFVPNMITGCSQADAAILVINASPGGFESGFLRGGQSFEHLLLAKSFGIKKIIIAVNKMDHPMVKWNEAVFSDIKQKLTGFLREIGFEDKHTIFVPISGLTGTNVVKSISQEYDEIYGTLNSSSASNGQRTILSDKSSLKAIFDAEPMSDDDYKAILKWYGKSPSLLEAIELYCSPPPALSVLANQPPRFLVTEMVKREHSKTVELHGRLDSGIVYPSMTLGVYAPSDNTEYADAIQSAEKDPSVHSTKGKSNVTLAQIDENVLKYKVLTVDSATLTSAPFLIQNQHGALTLSGEVPNLKNTILAPPAAPVRSFIKFKAFLHVFPSLAELSKRLLPSTIAGSVSASSEISHLSSERMMAMPLWKGMALDFHIGATVVPCTISRILRLVDKELSTASKKPTNIPVGASAVVRLVLQTYVPLETFQQNQRLSLFALRYTNNTVASGVVVKLYR